MGIFNSANNGVAVAERQRLEQNYKICRSNLILVVVFTLINVALIAFDANLYFLFSAFLPFFITDLGKLLSGRYPADFYVGDYEGVDVMNDTFFYIMVAVALVFILAYFLCWLLSGKRRVAWIIVALVLFAVDTVCMMLLGGFSLDSIVDILFHAWVLYYLIIGVVAHFKLNKLAEQELLATPDELNVHTQDIRQ